MRINYGGPDDKVAVICENRRAEWPPDMVDLFISVLLDFSRLCVVVRVEKAVRFFAERLAQPIVV